MRAGVHSNTKEYIDPSNKDCISPRQKTFGSDNKEDLMTTHNQMNDKSYYRENHTSESWIHLLLLTLSNNLHSLPNYREPCITAYISIVFCPTATDNSTCKDQQYKWQTKWSSTMWTDIFIIKLFRAQCDLGQLYNLHEHVAAEAWQQYKTSSLLLSLSNDREKSNVMWLNYNQQLSEWKY